MPRAPAACATSTKAAPGRPSSTTPAGTRPPSAARASRKCGTTRIGWPRAPTSSPPRARGTHDFAFGYDTFKDVRFSVNHQSGSDFRLAAEGYFFDAQNNVYPIVSGRGLRAGSACGRCSASIASTPPISTPTRTTSTTAGSSTSTGASTSASATTRTTARTPAATWWPTTPRPARAWRPAMTSRATATGLQRELRHLRGRDRQQHRRPAVDRRRHRTLDTPVPWRADQPRGAACLATNTCVNSDQATQMAIDWWLGFTGFNPLTDAPSEIAALPDPLGAWCLPGGDQPDHSRTPSSRPPPTTTRSVSPSGWATRGWCAPT